MIVVDANVAVRFSVRHSFSEQAIELLQKAWPVVAPDLIIPEFVNSFVNMLRLKTVDADRARDAVEFAPRWFEELVPARVLHRRAFALSRELSHSAYDCFYVALAEERGCPFVTMDDRLLRKLAHTSFARMAIHLSDWRPS